MYFELVNRQDQSTCDRFWKDSHFFIIFLKKKKRKSTERRAREIWGKAVSWRTSVSEDNDNYYWRQ